MDQSRLLGIGDCKWKMSLLDDSLQTIFNESLVLTNSEYVASGGPLTIVSAKSYSVYNDGILVL